MNPFELFSIPAEPKPDQDLLKSRYLEEAARLHPDRVQGGAAEREEAGRKLAEWNGAFETLSSPRLRLALLGQLLTGEAPARTGRVSGPGVDRMMKVAEVCRKADRVLEQRKQAQGAIEVAMLGGEIVEATDLVSAAQGEIADWEQDLEKELQQLQEDWEKGRHDAAGVEGLFHFFSYAEKARKQLEERFLKLAESLG